MAEMACTWEACKIWLLLWENPWLSYACFCGREGYHTSISHHAHELAAEAYLTSLWQKWATNAKHNKFKYYCEKIVHYSQEAFVEAKETRQACFSTPMTWSQRYNIGRICMQSHSLEIETGAWTGTPKSTKHCAHVPTDRSLRMRSMYLLSAPAMHMYGTVLHPSWKHMITFIAWHQWRLHRRVLIILARHGRHLVRTLYGGHLEDS